MPYKKGEFLKQNSNGRIAVVIYGNNFYDPSLKLKNGLIVIAFDENVCGEYPETYIDKNFSRVAQMVESDANQGGVGFDSPPLDLIKLLEII